MNLISSKLQSIHYLYNISSDQVRNHITSQHVTSQELQAAEQFYLLNSVLHTLRAKINCHLARNYGTICSFSKSDRAGIKKRHADREGRMVDQGFHQANAGTSEHVGQVGLTRAMMRYRFLVDISLMLFTDSAIDHWDGTFIQLLNTDGDFAIRVVGRVLIL